MGSLMNDLVKMEKKAQREKIKRQKIQARIQYNNTIQKIEEDNIAYNAKLKSGLYNLARPQLQYELTVDLDKFVEEYYNNQKKNRIGDQFEEDIPISLSDYLKDNNVPKKKIIQEKFSNSKMQKRIGQENKYTKEYNEVYLKRIKELNTKRKNLYNNWLKNENDKIIEFNNNLERRKQKFYNANEKEVEIIISKLFENSIVFKVDNDEYVINEEFSFDSKKRTLNVDLVFFSPSILSRLPKNRTYVKKDDEYRYTCLSENEINRYYESYLLNTALFIIYSIANIFEEFIDYFYLNCYVDDINPNSGKKDKILVLSSNVESISLKHLNIKNVNAKEYFKSIKSRISRNMKNLMSVEPISICRTEKYEKYSIDSINYDIDGFEFEKLSRDLLLANNFKNVEVTKSSGDYGADVIAYKDEIKYAIQCKKYSSKVGVKAVQEVIASKSMYNCHVAVVLTNNYFTPSAIKLAQKNSVLLWDRDKLIIMLQELKDEKELMDTENENLEVI